MSSDSWLRGKVARGAGRGRELGWPTANLELADPSLRPTAGIYAAWARVDGSDPQPAAVHVGPAPTVNRTKSIFEVHLINFPDRDFYDTQFEVQIVERIRNVEKFDSLSDLTDAIANDCQATLNLLGA
jgi:riboflavin kinase/FMN adenylyltransferase